MGHKVIDGFQVLEQISGQKFLRVESSRIDDYVRYYESDKSFGISTSLTYGYKLDDLDFLEGVPDLTELYVQDPIADISGLVTLKALRWLLLAGNKNKLDFSNFPHLEVLRAGWGTGLKNLDCCRKLRRLYFSKFNPKSKNLLSFSNLTSVEELELVQSTIESLEGVEKLIKLNALELYYMRNLEDFSSLLSLRKTLTKLRFGHCKKLEGIEKVAELGSLKALAITDCGEIPSIGFITRLKNLDFFSFVNTNVIDGDLTPLLDCKSLTFAGFLNKRHYSHKSEEIKALLKAKQAV